MVDIPGSVLVNISLTAPRSKIGTSPVVVGLVHSFAWDVERPQSRDHDAMAHLREYSHKGWLSSQVGSSWGVK